MELTLTLEQRFYRTPDGTFWSDGVYPYPFWRRYLEVYSSLRVVARVLEVDSAEKGWMVTDGAGVQFLPLPYYLGPLRYAAASHKLRMILANHFRGHQAVICRVPSKIGSIALSNLHRQRRPYGLEVVGDPLDVFTRSVVSHPLRAYFRYDFSRGLRKQCRCASSLLYVTESALQKRYPPARESTVFHASDVDLPPDAYAKTPRQYSLRDRPWRLCCIGSLEHMVKAPDILFKAMQLCRKAGADLHLEWIGDGKMRPSLEIRAQALGVADRIGLTGKLPSGQEIRSRLDHADLFILPSRTEGLPRALVEAMARGLPCIASSVGGIPELLPPEDLVPPNDAPALASKIMAVVARPERMCRMSIDNLEKAKRYRNDILQERRVMFHRCLRNQTEEWLEKHQS